MIFASAYLSGSNACNPCVIYFYFVVLINGGVQVKYGTHKKSATAVCNVTWEGSVRTLDGHKWLCDAHILGHLRGGEGGEEEKEGWQLQ